MQPRVFIVHGWGGHPAEAWMPWLQRELEKEGFQVTSLAMPHPDEPTIQDWVGHVAAAVGEPNVHTFLVGHSIGCQTILRYLASLEGARVGGAVLVAPWIVVENLEEEEMPIARPWMETPIDTDQVRAATSNFTALISDNDPYGAIERNKEWLASHLRARVLIEHNKGHYSDDSGVTELPAARAAILEYAHGTTNP